MPSSFAINFTNNNLLGSANFVPVLQDQQGPVCVTVGMMTTGYDCPDILNLGLFRPIFSPTDFIQIKGRGTRRHMFYGPALRRCPESGGQGAAQDRLQALRLLCQLRILRGVLQLRPGPDTPQTEIPGGGGRGRRGSPTVYAETYEHLGEDIPASVKEEKIGYEGMKIDRMFFERFEDTVRQNDFIAASVEAGKWDRVIDYVNREVFDKTGPSTTPRQTPPRRRS